MNEEDREIHVQGNQLGNQQLSNENPQHQLLQ